MRMLTLSLTVIFFVYRPLVTTIQTPMAIARIAEIAKIANLSVAALQTDKQHVFAYLCSHIRNADSNWSVLTGFARYSEAPASRHFSRSPFMALAVSAMMGRRRNDGFWRMTCIVS